MGSNFPSTRISLLQKLRDPQCEGHAEAFDTLATLYWRPVYKYIRLKWNRSVEDAQDLTQAFFTRVLEKNYFSAYDPQIARFRTFLRTCLDGFVANEFKSNKAAKRGGNAVHVALDLQVAEKELTELQNRDTPETIFEREWVRSVFRVSLEELRRRFESASKQQTFALFERYDIDSDQEISYKQLSSEFGISVSQVTNALADARRQFRKIVLQTLHDSTGSEEEFRNEVRSLLGIEIE